jgi:hypothetical protein
VAQEIIDEKAWVAVISKLFVLAKKSHLITLTVHAGATTALKAAISATDPSYNSSAAVTVYAVEGRNENAL